MTRLEKRNELLRGLEGPVHTDKPWKFRSVEALEKVKEDLERAMQATEVAKHELIEFRQYDYHVHRMKIEVDFYDGSITFKPAWSDVLSMMENEAIEIVDPITTEEEFNEKKFVKWREESKEFQLEKFGEYLKEILEKVNREIAYWTEEIEEDD